MLQRPQGLEQLARASARIGADPLLIQAAGGNTSIKDGGVMWIKASGTLLADAETSSIFVPVDLPAMRSSLAVNAARADQPAQFLIGGSGLRPSIETSLHAVFPQQVVMHVHCVNTIALAIRSDARAVLAEKLGAFDWAFVPYVKPGARLAAQVAEVLKPGTNVIVLGNHGLIVAGESTDETMALLGDVVRALEGVAQSPQSGETAALDAICGDEYLPLAQMHPLHGVAHSPARLAMAAKGSLYPDHVIFCGVGATVITASETVDDVVARFAAMDLKTPVFLLAAGKGALVHSQASAGARALARCLGDVLARVPNDAKLNYLTDAQNAELLDWDAEKYRQAMNAN